MRNATVFRQAVVFDGTAFAPRLSDMLVDAGRIAEVAEHIDALA